MIISRLYYRLPELAEKWGKTEEDILQMAAAGELELSVNHYGWGLNTDKFHEPTKIAGYVQIDALYAESILNHGLDGMSETIGFVRWRGDKIDIRAEGALERYTARCAEILTQGYKAILPYSFSADPLRIKSNADLLILHDEAQRIEEDHDELVQHSHTPPAADHDRNPVATKLIGTSFRRGKKDICEMVGKTWDTVESYKGKGLVVIEDPSGSPLTTDEEYARWLKSGKKK